MNRPIVIDSHKPRNAGEHTRNVSKSANFSGLQHTTPSKPTKPTHTIVMHKDFGLHVASSDGKSVEACPAFSIKGCVVDANGQNPAYLMCFETLLGSEVTEAIPLAVLASPEQLVKLLLSRGFAVPQNNIKERGQAIKHYMEYNCPIEKNSFELKAMVGRSCLTKQLFTYAVKILLVIHRLNMACTVKIQKIQTSVETVSGGMTWLSHLKMIRWLS